MNHEALTLQIIWNQKINEPINPSLIFTLSRTTHSLRFLALRLCSLIPYSLPSSALSRGVELERAPDFYGRICNFKLALARNSARFLSPFMLCRRVIEFLWPRCAYAQDLHWHRNAVCARPDWWRYLRFTRRYFNSRGFCILSGGDRLQLEPVPLLLRGFCFILSTERFNFFVRQ